MDRVFIIAEAGVNHNGSLDTAKKLVDIASEAGVDAVKFQTFNTDSLVCKLAKKANYQVISRESHDETQHSMLQGLELNEVAHNELILHCKDRNILFLSTPFDIESVGMLERLGMPIFKIPSGEITNLPYLRRVGRLGKEVILSTGMATLNEVKYALDVLASEGTQKSNIRVMHATTEYPCPINEVNLRAMLTIQNELGVRVGYSDHTKGIEIPIAAVALGACVIEKHFTLDRSMDGPDHKSSLIPDELNAMVKAIRNIEKAMGDGVKRPSLSEYKNISSVRKSIVAIENINKGDVFSLKNIAVKRPGSGVSPIYWDDVLGQSAIRNFLPDELIEL